MRTMIATPSTAPVSNVRTPSCSAVWLRLPSACRHTPAWACHVAWPSKLSLNGSSAPKQAPHITAKAAGQMRALFMGIPLLLLDRQPRCERTCGAVLLPSARPRCPFDLLHPSRHERNLGVGGQATTPDGSSAHAMEPRRSAPLASCAA